MEEVLVCHLRPPHARNAQREVIRRKDQVINVCCVKKGNPHPEGVRIAPPVLPAGLLPRLEQPSVSNVRAEKKPLHSLLRRVVPNVHHRFLVGKEVPIAAFARTATTRKTRLVMNAREMGSVHLARQKQTSTSILDTGDWVRIPSEFWNALRAQVRVSGAMARRRFAKIIRRGHFVPFANLITRGRQKLISVGHVPNVVA
mmetsp:Transcript_34291/g.46377  ORF Transcript_34291/g.46377 Transcript_34291/m.46377 type:complete len:200 (-) Transcript_34291:201-800(-)